MVGRIRSRIRNREYRSALSLAQESKKRKYIIGRYGVQMVPGRGKMFTSPSDDDEGAQKKRHSGINGVQPLCSSGKVNNEARTGSLPPVRLVSLLATAKLRPRILGPESFGRCCCWEP